jgi:hypothetical protein
VDGDEGTFDDGVGVGRCAGTSAAGAVGIEAGNEEVAGAGEVEAGVLLAGAAFSLAGASGFGVVAGFSVRMSEERLRWGVGAGASAGVTAAGLGVGERSLATAAAPAASSDAPVIVRERVGVETGFGSSRIVMAGAEAAVVVGMTTGAEIADAGGEVFVMAAGAVTVGRGDVAGRFTPLAESFCEGRMGNEPETRGVRAGTVGSGIIWAVGASPGET